METHMLMTSLSQSTDLFMMACNAFQQAKAIFEVVANVHEEVCNRHFGL